LHGIRAQEVEIMLTAQPAEVSDKGNQEWLQVMIEVERAWQSYAEHVRSKGMDDPAIGRLWLRLWRAERRRDELLKTLPD
jgi:hypothetical protein